MKKTSTNATTNDSANMYHTISEANILADPLFLEEGFLVGTKLSVL